MTINVKASLQQIYLEELNPILFSKIYSNPILTQNPNLNIKDPTSEKINSLVEKMKEIMIQEKCVGFAAPQIGENLRIFIYKLPENNDFTVMINPILVPQGEEQIEDWEVCFSIPGFKSKVSRYKKIQVIYTSLTGEKITKTAEDFEARVIQHEYDHINPDGGILCVQRIIITDNEKFQKIIE